MRSMTWTAVGAVRSVVVGIWAGAYDVRSVNTAGVCSVRRAAVPVRVVGAVGDVGTKDRLGVRVMLGGGRGASLQRLK